MWLRDAIYLSLQNSDVVVTLSGAVRVGPETSLDPLIAETGIGQEVGKFNPKLGFRYDASEINEPPNAFFGPGIKTQTQYDEANFSASLTQPLTTGGTASVAYAPPLAYIFFPQGVSAGQYNPAYSADLVFTFNQPLLRNGGRPKNLAPIYIAQAKTDQANWEVQGALMSQVRSVSEAYWDLQAAYISLQAIQSVIPLAEESVRLEKARFELEQIIYADVARAQVQVEELQRQQVAASLDVRRRNFQLNQLIGIVPTQADAIAPVDVPVQQRLEADLSAMMMTAVEQLPRLSRMRRQLDIRQMQLLVAQKDLLPDVNFLAQYRASGLTDQLDTAISQASTFNYTSWTLGMNFSYPLGNLQARSKARAAELELVRDQLLLKRTEEQAGYTIAQLVAEMNAAWDRYESARRQVDQAHEWLRLSGLRYSNPLPKGRDGNWLLVALVDYQNSMRGYVEAVTTAAVMLAEYNKVLARLDEAQGISLQRWNISFMNGKAQPPAAGETPPPGVMQANYQAPPAAVPVAAPMPMASQLAPVDSGRPIPLSPPGWGHSMIGSYRSAAPIPGQFPAGAVGHSVQGLTTSYRHLPAQPVPAGPGMSR